jgi:ribosome-associated toxin RatA of RatAB toxin-antitoxin module
VQRKTKRGLELLAYVCVTLPAVFAGILAIAVALPVAAAATIAVESERHGDAVYIHAAVVLKADAATAWRVMTDYNRYAEFIPELRLSRIVARRGSTVIVEQSGDATFWLFKLPLDITFEINEIPPSGLQSRAVAGSLRSLTSSYALTPVTSGTRLDYHGHVEPGFAPFGQIAQTAVERNVARQFQALADEIERQSAKAASQPIAGVK